MIMGEGGGGMVKFKHLLLHCSTNHEKEYFSSQIQYNKYIRQFVASDSKIYM
jgi:hypothetical protein